MIFVYKVFFPGVALLLKLWSLAAFKFTCCIHCWRCFTLTEIYKYLYTFLPVPTQHQPSPSSSFLSTTLTTLNELQIYIYIILIIPIIIFFHRKKLLSRAWHQLFKIQGIYLFTVFLCLSVTYPFTNINVFFPPRCKKKGLRKKQVYSKSQAQPSFISQKDQATGDSTKGRVSGRGTHPDTLTVCWQTSLSIKRLPSFCNSFKALAQGFWTNGPLAVPQGLIFKRIIGPQKHCLQINIYFCDSNQSCPAPPSRQTFRFWRGWALESRL